MKSAHQVIFRLYCLCQKQHKSGHPTPPKQVSRARGHSSRTHLQSIHHGAAAMHFWPEVSPGRRKDSGWMYGCLKCISILKYDSLQIILCWYRVYIILDASQGNICSVSVKRQFYQLITLQSHLGIQELMYVCSCLI